MQCEVSEGIVLLGDPHLGKGLSKGISSPGVMNSRITDQINLLDWVLEQAIAKLAGHIVITGDVFEDTKPHHSLIALFIAWCKRCEANDIQVHIIQGNHDMLRTGLLNTSSLDVIIESDMPTTSVYKDVATIFIGTAAITLIPFRDRKFFNLNSNAEAVVKMSDLIAYELASIPSYYRKILVGHLAIEGAIYIGDEVDDVANELICPLSMFAGYDYVWMGHIHKQQVIQERTKTQPHIAHIGSMDISDFGETNETKVIIHIDNTIDTITLPTRAFKKIAVSIPADVKDGTQYVIDQLATMDDVSNSILRVEIQLASSETLPIDRGLIEKHLYTNNAFNVSGITQSKAMASVKKQENKLTTTMDVASSIKTWIITRLPEEKQQAVLELALDCHSKWKEAQ
jgi:exonuclease SbcD